VCSCLPVGSDCNLSLARPHQKPEDQEDGCKLQRLAPRAESGSGRLRSTGGLRRWVIMSSFSWLDTLRPGGTGRCSNFPEAI
jgi:hypothetical protein